MSAIAKLGNFSAVTTKAIGVGMLAVVLVLSGCGRSPEEQAAYEKERAEEEAKAEYKRKNPDVTVVGTFDGCEVKFYKRGYSSENFHIAKCIGGTTTTVSTIERKGSHKHPYYVEKFDVTHEIERLEANKELTKEQIDFIKAKNEEIKKDIEKFLAEKAEAEKKKAIVEKAKQKLSAEELSALGIK